LANHNYRAPKAKKDNNNNIKPKSAAATPKAAGAAAAGAAKAGGRGGRKAGRAGRPKAKTVEELDAEMSEYFDPNAVVPAANNGVSAPAAGPVGGDATMEDEIL
jgi:THO complex subunit 4